MRIGDFEPMPTFVPLRLTTKSAAQHLGHLPGAPNHIHSGAVTQPALMHLASSSSPSGHFWQLPLGSLASWLVVSYFVSQLKWECTTPGSFNCEAETPCLSFRFRPWTGEAQNERRWDMTLTCAKNGFWFWQGTHPVLQNNTRQAIGPSSWTQV